MKTGYHQPCLAAPLPAGWEAGGPSSVSSIHQEVDSDSVYLGNSLKNNVYMSTMFEGTIMLSQCTIWAVEMSLTKLKSTEMERKYNYTFYALLNFHFLLLHILH